MSNFISMNSAHIESKHFMRVFTKVDGIFYVYIRMSTVVC